MDFNQLVLKRQSVRGYADKQIEKEKITQCIEAARLAPSACNSQPWTFIIVDDKELKNKVAKATYDELASFNKFTKEANVIIVVVMEIPNFSAKIGSIIKDIDYAHIDMGIAVEHFCLQATELGLGTCILGWSKQSKIKKILNIPKNKKVGLLITVGYAKEEKIREKLRKSQKEMSCYNKYCKK